MRGRIVERDAAHHARVCRIGDVDDRGAELFFVRDVPDIGVVAGDVDLTRAGQIEMADAPHIAGERAIRPIDFIHRLYSLGLIVFRNRDYLSTWAPEALTTSAHFGTSLAI